MSGLVLASGSPQRRAILEQLGVPFSVQVPGVPEREQGPAEVVALQNAARKAEAVAANAPEALVLGVDTVVELGGRLYGKPRSPEAALQTLSALSDQTHSVISALCLLDGGERRTATSSTQVTFRVLNGRLLAWYLDSGEWRGRAGGYAIQGKGAALVSEISGDYLGVVGLPVAALLDLEPRILWR